MTVTVEQVTSHKWPTIEVPIAELSVPVDALATHLALEVQTWSVDGLGQARGFGFRASSGRVFLLQDLELAVRFQGAAGPAAYADASDVVVFGVRTLVDEVIAALDLSPNVILTIAESRIEQFSADVVANSNWMTIQSHRELEAAREKLRLLEERCEANQRDTERDGHVRELSMCSLMRLMKQLKEEIARF